jgi:hypothetical protein
MKTEKVINNLFNGKISGDDANNKLNNLFYKKKSNNIIIVTSPCFEVFSTFTKLCREKKLPYHYLKRFKFPIIYKDYVIEKRPLL